MKNFHIDNKILIEIISKGRYLSDLTASFSVSDETISALVKNESLRNYFGSLAIYDTELLTKNSYPDMKILMNTKFFGSLTVFNENATEKWEEKEIFNLLETQYRCKKAISCASHEDLFLF